MAGKILIVDDFRTNLAHLSHLLNHQGYEVKPVVQVDDALELINNVAFDLFLLDVEMPVSNGFELCRSIRRSVINADTPVIFITSRDDQQSILSGFDAGGQDYITRPFSDRELLARVNTHLELKLQRESLIKLTRELENLVSIRTRELRKLLVKLKTSNQELSLAKKELESLDSAKEQFLRIINHEIRTPLNGILGFQDLLKDAQLDEKYAEYLQMMNDSVKRLEKFSLQALLITQLRTGSYFSEPRTVWIDTEFQKALADIDNELKGKQLRLRYQISPASIHIDSGLLQHLIFNLVENAIYHGCPGGIIEISGGSTSANRYRITVFHSGHEFSESILSKALTLFSEDSFTDGCPHLFLYTIRLIMDRLHGDLLLRNISGAGAELAIELSTGSQVLDIKTNIHDKQGWII